MKYVHCLRLVTPLVILIKQVFLIQIYLYKRMDGWCDSECTKYPYPQSPNLPHHLRAMFASIVLYFFHIYIQCTIYTPNVTRPGVRI